LIDVAITADRNVTQNEAEKKLKYNEFRDITNVVHEMYDYTGKNWSQWNSKKKKKTFKEKLGSHAGKTFDRFTTKDSYTWNITQNTESTAV
jgi:Mn-containing catalase